MATKQALDEQQLVVETTALPAVATGRRWIISCLLVVFGAILINTLWLLLDRRTPSADEASHLLDALRYKQLLHHLRPAKLHWWHEILTVNQFYPPAVFAFNGLLKMLLGSGRWVDNVCYLLYSGLLTASTFGITYRASGKVSAAVAAAVVLNCYPQIAHLSHVYMLDLPLAAMVSVGVLALMWWDDNRTWKRTLATAAIIAAACLTKQLGALYLIPPCLALLLKRRSAKLVVLGVLVAMVVLPWLWTNAGWINAYARENLAVMGDDHKAPFAVFADYFIGLAYSMSFVLSAACAICACFVPRTMHRSLALLYLSTIGGLTLTSLLSCTFPLDRYAAPALVLAAVVTALGGTQIWHKYRLSGRAFCGAVAMVAVAQYISFSWSPFPISLPGLSEVAPTLGVGLREFRGQRIVRSSPQPAESEAKWVLQTIAQRDGQNPVWLNLLPSYGAFNPNSFELVADELRLSVKPTTSRRWTIMGDQVSFTPETANYFQWYLLKTGFQGNKFKDADSAANYDKLIDYVIHSGKFDAVATRTLADGSMLMLYRQH